jgi:hypothetical protein
MTQHRDFAPAPHSTINEWSPAPDQRSIRARRALDITSTSRLNHQ